MQIQIPAGLSQEEAEVYTQLDPDRLPRHIAIIMDGNGRWAKSRNLPRVAGHKAGVEAVRSVITCAARIHLPAITMYAFSVENWKRPKDETNFIMGLILGHLKPELPLFEENNVRMEFIGRFNELPADLQEDMDYVRQATAKNTGLVMTLALNYGARAEIIDAFQKIISEADKNGGLQD
ncbi:MAG TPA: polyprenyl diphosphate synthase, partial [Candidatus Acidoferrales bacterium]|nr:polyprenyl diphosphate synthase [Candidatus Acidoferrales bacterium]